MNQSTVKIYLSPTYYMDFNHPVVQEFVQTYTTKGASQLKNAVQLYYAVRDEIRYNPYYFSMEKVAFKASKVLERKEDWCVPKAVLYAACCRAIEIPALLGYADVRNHLSTERMRQQMKTDVFAWHGYTELYLEGKWVKATPAFNKALTDKFRLKALEFDGTSDSIYHPFDLDGNQHMEYIKERGTYPDVPLTEMLQSFAVLYPYLNDTPTTGDFEADVEKEIKQSKI